MEATLRDGRAERRLARDGFVVVPEVARGDLPALRELIGDREVVTAAAIPTSQGWRRQSAPGRLWRLSLDDDDRHDRERLEQQTAGFWDRLLAELFVDHRHLVTALLTKGPGEDSALPLHQDPTVVDEARFRSSTVWVALDDVDRRSRNGALHVLPGSHLRASDPRGTNTVPSFLPHLDRLWDRAVPVDVRAGDAVVLDSRVIHGSPPNWSQRSRRVISAVIVPRRAELVHVVASPGDGDEVVTHRADLAFWRRYNPRALSGAPPADLPVIGRSTAAPGGATIRALLRGARWRKARATAGRWLAEVVPG